LQKKFKLLGLSLMILAVIILLYAWGFAMQTVDYYISSDKINDKLKIVFISDLHNCTYGGADQSGLLDEIHNADPDLVLFGGDVIDQYDDYDNALTLMSEVAKEYPACYTSGNHEHKRSDLEQFRRQVSETGIHCLEEGKSFQLTVRNQNVRIYGVLEPNELSMLDTPIDENYYNILLAHFPQYINRYLSNNFDLILSGHAHGGQWRLPFILEQGLYAPDQGIFPSYTNGMYTYGDSVHIISKGLARTKRMILIPRIFNRPEFSVIEIS